MDSLSELSGQLMGLWLVIVGIAIAFGVLFAIVNALRGTLPGSPSSACPCHWVVPKATSEG